MKNNPCKKASLETVLLIVRVSRVTFFVLQFAGKDGLDGRDGAKVN